MVTESGPPGPRLTERDLAFVVETAAPAAKDKARLQRLVAEDARFREGLIRDERVFRQVMADDESFIRISPGLYFEILLRKTARDLGQTSHTYERSGTQMVAVLDSGQVTDLLSRDGVLEYLAEMLSSFTRIRSYTRRVRVRKGVWHRIRFNDMDVDSLIRTCGDADPEQRFPLYRRIADVCLFTVGVFPEHAQWDHRYGRSDTRRPSLADRRRRSREEYEAEGRRAYGLAARHPAARLAGLSGALSALRDHFNEAAKPLSFMSEHYLRFTRQRLFGADPE